MTKESTHTKNRIVETAAVAHKQTDKIRCELKALKIKLNKAQKQKKKKDILNFSKEIEIKQKALVISETHEKQLRQKEKSTKKLAPMTPLERVQKDICKIDQERATIKAAMKKETNKLRKEEFATSLRFLDGDMEDLMKKQNTLLGIKPKAPEILIPAKINGKKVEFTVKAK